MIWVFIQLAANVSDVRSVICRRNLHEVETDSGFFEGPGGRRQVNGLEGGSSEGFVEKVFELERLCLFEGMERWLGRGKKIEL